MVACLSSCFEWDYVFWKAAQLFSLESLTYNRSHILEGGGACSVQLSVTFIFEIGEKITAKNVLRTFAKYGNVGLGFPSIYFLDQIIYIKVIFLSI